jgi:hypothetical protein
MFEVMFNFNSPVSTAVVLENNSMARHSEKYGYTVSIKKKSWYCRSLKML